jgi:hypothetical protein
MSEAKFQRKTDAREQTMGDDDKELTEDEINRLFSADFLYDSEPTECESDAEALAKLDELDAFDRFVRMWSDDRSRGTSLSALPVSAIPTPVTHELPVEVATEPSEIGSTISTTDFFDKVPLRSTIRKAGRFLPNCFGSQFLHDPESADCGPCKFSEGCKKAIVDEMPVLEAARKAREAHFQITGRGKLPPVDPKRIEFLRDLLRGHHLTKYQKARKQRRTKDQAYQQEKRANPAAETLIEKELQERLSALHSAIAGHRKDKFLQQLRGREAMIMAVWESEQHAHLARGPTVSAAQVAKTFNEMIGDEGLSRHQARTYQGHFRKLEQLPHVWKRFVKSPDDKIA